MIHVTGVRDSVAVNVVVTVVNRAVRISIGLTRVQNTVAVTVSRASVGVGDRQICGTRGTIPTTHLDVVTVSSCHRHGHRRVEVR